MFTFNDIADIVNNIECTPYEMRLDCMQCVRAEKLSWHDGGNACEDATHTWFLQARLWRADTHTKNYSWGAGGKYVLSPHCTRDEIVKKALTACLAYAEHEVRESFMYRGRRVFGPHLSVEALWEVAEQTEERDT